MQSDPRILCSDSVADLVEEMVRVVGEHLSLSIVHVLY